MEAKSFNEIMEQITSCLVGDSSVDIPYLKSQCDAYKDHEYSQEIIRACGRMMFELLPEDKRAEIEKIINNHQSASQSILEETSFNLGKGDSDKALSIILPYANEMLKLEEGGWAADDKQSEFHDFQNPIQKILYMEYVKPEKEIREAVEPFSQIYLLAASCLFEQKRFDEAIEWLERAIQWNPAAPELFFELGENYKQKGEFHKAEDICDQGYPYIYQASQLAKLYRTKGFCSIEYGDYELAAAYFVVSMAFDSSKLAMSEIMYMKMKYGQDYTDMDVEKAHSVLESAGIEVGPHENAVTVLSSLISTAVYEGEIEFASQCAFALWQLTRDEDVKELLDSLAARLDNEEEE